MNILWIFYLCTILCHWNFVSAKVTSSPSITSNGPVKEGTRIKLTCTAKCDNSTCEYTWTSELTSPNKTMILDIPVNRSYKNEEFKCTVRDTGDNDTKSATKTFDVFYGPDKVTVAAGSSITVVEGELSDKRNLTCKALNCNPKCNFTWTRNGNSVSYTTALFPTNRQILRDNSSSYTCTALNVKTGSKASSSVQIKVQYAPDVTLSWKKNENTLICRATGVPNDYTFSKIQQKVEDVLVKKHDVTVSGDTATLNLKDKDYQDTGKYECFVDNGIIHYQTKNKTRNKTTQIEVEDKPVLVSSKPSYNVSKGSSLNISLTLYSYPKAQAYIDHQWAPIKSVFAAPEVEVKFHEIPVKIGGQEIILNLNEVLEKHFTKHTVYIKNIVGNISTDVTIFPEGPPDVPSNFSKSDISPDSVTFTLVTGFYNGAGQTIVVEHRLEGNQSKWSNKTVEYAGVEKDQRVNLVVTDLTPETVYEFRAFAYNEYSRSGYTETIKGKTNEVPVSAGVIAGAVSGSVVLIIIVSVVVVLLILRYRRKEKDIGGGTYNEQNKDLTVEMPVYENNQQHNVYTGEPEQEPHRPSIIYENTMVAIGQEGTRNDGFYDVPPSQVSSSSEQMETNRKDVKENGETIPPYLDLNNPDAVDEAYLGADHSKMLVQQSSAKSNLSDGEYLDVSQSKMLTNVKQDQAVSEDYYLDMNQVKEVKESPKRPKEKESPYVNAQKSNKRKDDSKVNSSKDGMDYQNVAKYKKNKSRTGKEDKPYENTKKEADKGKLEDAEEAKDYQNVNQYKKVPKQQVSVESNSELYMEMSAESSRQSVASIPGYNAPPPPLEEENYMNIRIGKPK